MDRRDCVLREVPPEIRRGNKYRKRHDIITGRNLKRCAMNEKTLFCRKCNKDTIHALVFPSCEKNGNRYAAVCSVCLSLSSAFVEEPSSDFTTFFCSSWQCQMSVRGSIVRKNGMAGRFENCFVRCPNCRSVKEILIERTKR